MSEVKEDVKTLVRNIAPDDTEKVLQDLKRGSRQYYHQLLLEKQLVINEEILPTIISSPSELSSGPLFTSTEADGKEFSIKDGIEELWLTGRYHAVLLGEGGMGKTVTLLHIWKNLLEGDSVPIFLNLNEYNTASETERQGFIIKRIVQRYLLGGDIWTTSEKETKGLVQLLNADQYKQRPRIILLLDGFNEITVPDQQRRLLSRELEELLGKKSISIITTSREKITSITDRWVSEFQTLILQALEQEKAEVYLQSHKIEYPDEPKLRQILQNPMMLTLYANTCEIFE